MTLVCSVMAWAGKIDYKALPMPNPDGAVIETPAPAKAHKAVKESEDPVNEAKIGETEYATLFEAFIAAENNDVIELLADVNPSTWYAGELDNTSVTIKGNGHVIRKTPIFVNETDDPMVITFDGVTINAASWFAYAIGDVTIVLADGTTNTLTSAKNYGFCGQGAGDLKITGNGELSATATYMFYQMHSVVLEAGTYNLDPMSYVDLEHFVVTKVSSTYKVSAPAADVVAYNPALYTTYTSLSAAIDAASTGAELYLYKNDETAISVGKNLAIHTVGKSTALTAAAGYSKAVVGQDIFFTDNAIAAFLMADGNASLTIDENADISNAGAIHVHGTKTLTINEGVTVTYKRQGSLANIVVDNGAKLTVLGSGTFTPVMHSATRTIEGFTAEISTSASNQIGNRVIDVDGELVVGVKNDAANCPHFITSSIARGSAVMVNETGVATFNNADMRVANMSIKNYGNVTIHGGEYVSIATCRNQINNEWYAYHLNNEGIMTVNGGHFVGVQGAFANVSANAIVDIYGGSFETVYGHNWATGEANTGANKDNHYALYVACYSVVNVYGGSYKVQTPSLGGNVVVLVGNNDAYNTYGIVNLYGGNFQQKVKIQARKNAQSSYPASIPPTSQWYGCFGSEAPLPAGYEYYETGDATYPWGVRAIPGANVAEVESNDPTIPWQQNTTWDADWTGGDDVVPEDNTIVTIPVGKTVVVDKDESETNAVAQQVFIAQDATLKVEDGTTLTVGEGGMNIGNGGKLIVEPGAIVKVGDAGVITTDNNALVIEATETDQAVLLYDPTVPQSENTQPQATVKLTTKSKMLNNSPFQYTYQRFALPIKAAATPENDFDPAIHEYYDATEESYGFESYIYYWNSHSWANCKWNALVPFKGYQLANNSKNGGVVYTFKGNLIGNEDGEYEFAEYGFDFFGNSYTAPINVETFLTGFGSDVEATIWLYDYTTTNWRNVSLEDFEDGLVEDQYKQIKSMDGFLLNLRAASGSANVNYNDAIWSNPLLGSSPSLAPARRAANSNLSNSAVITVVEANGHGDAVTLVEKATRSSEFENGADASKYMTEDGLSLYAETNAGQLSRVATNDLSNTVLTFRAGNETNYSLTIDKAQGEDYILRDNVTGNTIAMTNGATYNFTQAANTTVPARFEVIGIAKMPTAIDNIEAAANASGIYTVTGQFLGHDFTNLPAGVYVVNGVKIVK